MDLLQKSIEIISANQSPWGSYVASPHFATYRYCWLRDGTFIAYAMDLAGEYESAGRFYAWVAAAINRHAMKVARLLERLKKERIVDEGDYLFARYDLDGTEGEDRWANFQLDGYGAWLWGLTEHVRMSGEKELLARFADSIETTILYLRALWQEPNYDCWEEYRHKIHPSTLACIYGGLDAINTHRSDREITDLLAEIKAFLVNEAIHEGRLVKFIGSTMVDASLLWLSTPFRVFAPDDEVMRATVARIEADLVTGGVHRYPEDTFYGGGEWILLTAWLGWYYAELGQLDRAHRLLSWVEEQVGREGNLPEQVPSHLNAPSCYPIWVRKWGDIASPLLWSHAMYIVLALSEEKGRQYVRDSNRH